MNSDGTGLTPIEQYKEQTKHKSTVMYATS